MRFKKFIMDDSGLHCTLSTLNLMRSSPKLNCKLDCSPQTIKIFCCVYPMPKLVFQKNFRSKKNQGDKIKESLINVSVGQIDLK